MADAGAHGAHDAELDRLRRDYAFAFLAYRVDGTEERLLTAYELGRAAMAAHLSLLELSKVHHDVVAEALTTASDEAAVQAITRAASEFFVEVLSTFEMAQRGFAEARATATAGEPPATDSGASD